MLTSRLAVYGKPKLRYVLSRLCEDGRVRDGSVVSATFSGPVNGTALSATACGDPKNIKSSDSN